MEDGVWRTIRGRRVFIRDGESLGSAMSRSGKFKRSDIKEKKSQARYDEATHKFWDNKSKKSNRQAENKMKRETLEPNKKQQAEKNRINENANIEGSGKTRVQRNWNRYSEEQRREVRHEEIQKKLAEYKAKKQSNNKIDIKNNNGELTGYTNNERIEYHHSGDTGLMASVYSTDEDDLLHGHFFNIPKEYQEGDKLKEYSLKEVERLKSDRKAYLQRQEAGIPEGSKYKNQVDDNYYKGTKRWGFGYANDDNIPVYNNKIDYSGDFTHANLSKVSNDDLKQIINKQTELYNEAVNRRVGDRRTYNGKKDQLFKDVETLRYSNGMKVAKEEAIKRENDKYPQYKGTPYEVKYYSVEDVFKDPNSKIRQFIDKKRSNRKNKDK